MCMRINESTTLKVSCGIPVLEFCCTRHSQSWSHGDDDDYDDHDEYNGDDTGDDEAYDDDSCGGDEYDDNVLAIFVVPAPK